MLWSLKHVSIILEHLIGENGRTPPDWCKHLQKVIHYVNTIMVIFFKNVLNFVVIWLIFFIMTHLNLAFKTPNALSTTTIVFPWLSLIFSSRLLLESATTCVMGILSPRATSHPLEETGLDQEVRSLWARMHRGLIQGSGHWCVGILIRNKSNINYM